MTKTQKKKLDKASRKMAQALKGVRTMSNINPADISNSIMSMVNKNDTSGSGLKTSNPTKNSGQQEEGTEQSGDRTDLRKSRTLQMDKKNSGPLRNKTNTNSRLTESSI